ncbi:MAG: cytidine deaminase [Anaerolineae bacterium]|nr:cytidine deaminase [Anaerolineae bacterium]
MALQEETRLALIAAAQQARRRAYAPYSGYAVGAALLAAGGVIVTGCNVENATYGATICAERTAVVKAISEGVRDFLAIAVVTENGGSPCGICRQVLYEFAPEMTVIIADTQGTVRHAGPLSDLLPLGFSPSDLE